MESVPPSSIGSCCMAIRSPEAPVQIYKAKVIKAPPERGIFGDFLKRAVKPSLSLVDNNNLTIYIIVVIMSSIIVINYDYHYYCI